MDAQFVLRVVGFAALVISVLFAVLAVHYYLTRDIRAVMDDLSGKTRARGVAGVRRSAARDRKREITRRAAASPVEDGPAQPQWQTSQPSSLFAIAEEGAGTAAAPAPVEDDIETLVEMVELADEPETMVEVGDDLDATELPDDAVSAARGETRSSWSREFDSSSTAASSTPSDFQVSRRVVHMPASQVIAASEEAGE